MKNLDNWDIQFIQICKCQWNNLSLNKFIRFWAERCALDEQYVHVETITDHYLRLVQELNLIEIADFIENLNPKNDWKYLWKESKDFDVKVLSRLVSVFGLAQVKKLPGYREYIEKLDKNPEIP